MKNQKLQSLRKSEAIRELERLANEAVRANNQHTPTFARLTFRDDTTEGLTECIETYIALIGGSSKHIIGSFTNLDTMEENVIGEVFANYDGMFLHIEINFWDNVTDIRLEMRAKHRSMGGICFQAYNFCGFKAWLDSLTQKKANHE